MTSVEMPVIAGFVVCTALGLLAWLLWSSHQQMISVTRQDRSLEFVDAYGFIKTRRRDHLADVVDIFKDSKGAENAGEKYFLGIYFTNGKRTRLTRPASFITKEHVDTIYDALRPFIAQPPATKRLAYFPHVKVSETPNQVTVTFRTQLHFISVRYNGILITMLAFFAAMILLNVFILIAVPTLFLYPGLLVFALPLLFLVLLLPWRKKQLAHNNNSATLSIHTDSQTMEVHTSKAGSHQDYPATPFTSIKVAPLGADSELTFAGDTQAEYTSYYTIGLNVGDHEVSLYETESHAEAMHVQTFLERLLLGNKT